MKRVLLIGVSVALLAGCATPAPEPSSAPSPFKATLKACGMSAYTEGVTLGDGDRSLILDMRGEEEFTGLSYTDTECVLEGLGVPDSTLTLMNTTRALDGRQSDSWADFEATWSYHPDNGLDIVIETIN